MFNLFPEKENETFHTRLSLTAGDDLEIPSLKFDPRNHRGL